MRYTTFLSIISVALISIPHTTHAENPRATALFEQGKMLFQEGRYEEAESAFREAIRYVPDITVSPAWIGLCLYYQNRFEEAKDYFRSVTGTFSADAKAYDGLGLVYLDLPGQEYTAIEAFMAAQTADPSYPDAHYHLGRTYVSMMETDRIDLLYADATKEALETAIDIAARHDDAYYQLGRLYEHTGKKRQAIKAYEKQMDVNPMHTEAGQALRRLGKKRDIAVPDSSRPDLHIDAALALWQLKVWDQALVQFERLIPQLDRRDLFYDMSLFDVPDSLKTRDSAPDEKEVSWHEYWTLHDPLPMTAVNERVVEHYGRVAYALKQYGHHQTPWDRRGEILFRYGLPDESLKERVFVPIGMSIAERPAWVEVWHYPNLQLTFLFMNRMYTQVYDYPDLFPTGIMIIDAELMERHPKKHAERAIARMPEGYYPSDMGDFLGFEYDYVVFRDEQNRPYVEMAYDIRAEDLYLYGTGIPKHDVTSGLVLLDDAGQRVVEDSSAVMLYVHRDNALVHRAVGVHRTLVPPGAYRMMAQVQDRTAYRFGVTRGALQVPAFGDSGVHISGIRLAYHIAANETRQPFLERNDLRIVPNPSRTYQAGSPVYLYAEFYDLTPVNGRTAYRIEVALEPADPIQGNPIWRFLTALGRRQDDGAVAFQVEDAGTAATAAWHSSIDTADLTAGGYILTIAVTDMATGIRAEREVRFELKAEG